MCPLQEVTGNIRHDGTTGSERRRQNCGIVCSKRNHGRRRWSISPAKFGYLTQAGLVLLLHIVSAVSSTPIVDIFPGVNDSSVMINHFAVDSSTGYVYVGAVNYIYRLDKDLSLLEQSQTGPHLDSKLCDLPVDPSTTCIGPNGIIEKSSTNNVNKVLVIDSGRNSLITCGSLYQGSCQIRSLSAVSQSTAYESSHKKHKVAANDATSSTVAFIGPGPPNALQDKVLYVGTTVTGEIDNEMKIRVNVPAVSSRKLDGDVFDFGFTHQFDSSIGTKVYLHDPVKEPYYVTYVDGFSVDAYSYFLTVQPKVNSQGKVPEKPNPVMYESHIIQICQDDKDYGSYVEIPLQCGDYNLIQSATVLRATAGLANRLGISSTDHNSGKDYILVASFAKGKSNTNNNVPSNNTAICMYSFFYNGIRAKAADAIADCYHGIGKLAEYITGPQTERSKCYSVVSRFYYLHIYLYI